MALIGTTALPSPSWTTVGDCANPIIMFLIPGTGEERPGQRHPDGTPKADNDPTRNIPTNPNAPPPALYSAPIPRYAFLGEGVPAAIESAN